MTAASRATRASLAVIGGSGFYEIDGLGDVETVSVARAITIARLGTTGPPGTMNSAGPTGTPLLSTSPWKRDALSRIVEAQVMT